MNATPDMLTTSLKMLAALALVLAGLAAEGETVISGVEYIERGYQKLEERLRCLGASLRRVEEPLEKIVG